ncbi:hypothetical protein OFC63_29995, partial [Escherichia coli]|nr:hypothetical protein [Escherichia coli]
MLDAALAATSPEKSSCNSTLRGGKSAISLYLRRIDLRALKSSAVIDVNGLPFAEDVEHLRARFAMPVAGRFGPAERQVDFGA